MVKEGLERKAIEGAIEHGLKELVGRNKYLFSGMEDYLNVHIDKKKINSKLSEIYKTIEEKNLGDINGSKFLYNKLKEYIASGSMFDLRGEEAMLKKGLEKNVEKSLWGRIKSFFEYLARPKEQKYLERTLKSANELYNSFIERKTIDSPELKAYGGYMKKTNSLYPLLEVMKEKNIITKNEAKKLYKEVAMGLEKRTEEFKKGLEKYITQKIAASVLGIAGISLIALSSRVTGAFIGVSNNTISNVIGVGMMLGSLLLIFNLKKKYKH